MADKAEKKPAAAEEGDGHKKKAGLKGMLTKLPVLLGGVMVIEAVVLFAGFKMLGGGAAPADAAEVHGEASGDGHGEAGAHGEGGQKNVGGIVELPALEFRAPNKLSGKTFLYDVAIFILVKEEHAESVKTMLEQRKALISDRVRTIIAQSDPEKLNGSTEPGLETLRRQVKFQLDEIIRDGKSSESLIEEVLVPRCIPFRTDF